MQHATCTPLACFAVPGATPHRCLQKDASARPSARELLAHPFVADAPPEAPAGLAEMVSEYSKRRKPVQSRRCVVGQLLLVVRGLSKVLRKVGGKGVVCVMDAGSGGVSACPSGARACACPTSFLLISPLLPLCWGRDAGSEILAGGTLPGWDFGPKGLGRITIRMGDTVKASTVDRCANLAGPVLQRLPGWAGHRCGTWAHV